MCTEWLWNGKNEENGTQVKHGQFAAGAAFISELKVTPLAPGRCRGELYPSGKGHKRRWGG